MIELKFKSRPVDVPTDLRLYRRLAMLAISLSTCCRSGSGSLRQLQFLNSIYLDANFLNLFLEFKSKKGSLKILSPSADPYLNRCIDYAIGAGLIAQKQVQDGYRVVLTDDGKSFVGKLKAESLAQDIFEVSSRIGKLSENEIKAAVMLEK